MSVCASITVALLFWETKKKSKLPNNLTRGRKNKKCGALVFSRAAQAALSLIKEQGMGFNNIYWSDDMF